MATHCFPGFDPNIVHIVHRHVGNIFQGNMKHADLTIVIHQNTDLPKY